MEVSALDENGKPVDWWFIYKVPKLAKDAGTDSATGYEYIYFDANIENVVRSPNLLNDNQGALDVTLNSIFQSRAKTTGYVLYNDEKPESAGGTDNGALGHTKGVIAFDAQSGTAFWLLHSWPKYADPEAKAKVMPTPMYGQTFMCISISLDTARALATQMANHQEPQVYLPEVGMLAQNDPLSAITRPLNPDAAGDSDVIDYVSCGGLAFKVIAKNRKWGKDFWNDLVGPTLHEDMADETWIRGKIPPVLDSDGIHKTYDIKYIDLSHIGAPWAWPETHDHAKWGITKDNNWVCVGDINRMVSQEQRGGGTIAFQNEILWTALSRTDLLVAPPGHSRVEARSLIKATHPSRAASGTPKATKPATAGTARSHKAPTAPHKKKGG